MICPNCDHRGTHVYGTQRVGDERLRYHHCPNCAHRFKTWATEEVDPHPVRTKHKPDPDACNQPDLFNQPDRKRAG